MVCIGDDTGLGRHVCDVSAVLPPIDGRDVDDATPALLLHVRQHETRQFVTVEHVEVEDGAGSLRGAFQGDPWRP